MLVWGVRGNGGGRKVQVAGVGAVGRVNDQQASSCVNFSA